MLLIPASLEFFQSAESLGARTFKVGKASTVHPRGVACRAQFQADNVSRGIAEQFPVVRDQHDRLIRFLELILQPNFPWNVEIVIGFIENQHFGLVPQ